MLTGELSQLSLRAVLRLLAEARFSGLMTLERRDNAGADGDIIGDRAGVVFRGGDICVALSDLRGVTGLTARLVRSECIDLTRLATLHADPSGDIVAMANLLAHATSAHPDAGRVVHAYTTDTVAWLLRATHEHFSTTPFAKPCDWPLPARTLDDLFASVTAHERERQSLTPIVRDLRMVCGVLPHMHGRRTVEITAEQWRTLAFIDGRRSLLEVAELAGDGHRTTCELMAGLVELGIVELVEPHSSSSLGALLDALDVLRPASLRPAGAPGADGSSDIADANSHGVGVNSHGANAPIDAAVHVGLVADEAEQQVPDATPGGVVDEAEARPVVDRAGSEWGAHDRAPVDPAAETVSEPPQAEQPTETPDGDGITRRDRADGTSDGDGLDARARNAATSDGDDGDAPSRNATADLLELLLSGASAFDGDGDGDGERHDGHASSAGDRIGGSSDHDGQYAHAGQGVDAGRDGDVNEDVFVDDDLDDASTKSDPNRTLFNRLVGRGSKKS